MRTVIGMGKKAAVPAACALCALLCVCAAAGTARQLRASAPAAASPPVVIIDAGHGGEDGGATGVGGLVEKELNLDIALCLRDTLRLCGLRVIMTRETDISLHTGEGKRKRSDLEARLRVMNDNPSAVTVSIHQNSYAGAGKARGAQVFFSANDEGSRALAESIRTAIQQRLHPDNRRAVKQADSAIFILYNAENPAVLVECAFLSNPQDALLLSNANYRAQFAFAVACGIIEYFEACG